MEVNKEFLDKLNDEIEYHSKVLKALYELSSFYSLNKIEQQGYQTIKPTEINHYLKIWDIKHGFEFNILYDVNDKDNSLVKIRSLLYMNTHRKFKDLKFKTRCMGSGILKVKTIQVNTNN